MFHFFLGFSFQLVKQVVLPRVHGLALKTTVATVCFVWDFIFICNASGWHICGVFFASKPNLVRIIRSLLLVNQMVVISSFQSFISYFCIFHIFPPFNMWTFHWQYCCYYLISSCIINICVRFKLHSSNPCWVSGVASTSLNPCCYCVFEAQLWSCTLDGFWDVRGDWFLVPLFLYEWFLNVLFLVGFCDCNLPLLLHSGFWAC